MFMKRYKFIYKGIVFILPMLFASCDVDTYEEVTHLEQVVSLVQVSSGTVALSQDNIIVDKENAVLKKVFGVALSGFSANQGFDVDIELTYDNLPEGCTSLTPEECYLTLNQNDTEHINSLNVPSGVQNKAFYVNFTKDCIDNYPDQLVGVKLKLKNLTKYRLNPLDSVYITLNTSDFSAKKIEVTDTYFLNSTFQREAGTTERFAPLADWIANDAVLNSRSSGAGYDENCGYMGIERWSSGDSPILNGKIYQTFTLPKGRYLVEVDLQKVAVERDTYLMVNLGDGLPDDVEVENSLARIEIKDEHNTKTLPLEFDLSEESAVSIGFLINIENMDQRILQASKIRLYRLESFFD